MSSFEKKLRAPKGIEPEHWFIECYRKHQGHPLKILVSLYKGNYYKFLLAIFFFFCKHACVWVLPIVTANIINDITAGNPDSTRHIMFYTLLMVFLIVLNVPMNYLYVDYKSQSTRYAETGLEFKEFPKSRKNQGGNVYCPPLLSTCFHNLYLNSILISDNSC